MMLRKENMLITKTRPSPSSTGATTPTSITDSDVVIRIFK